MGFGTAIAVEIADTVDTAASAVVESSTAVGETTERNPVANRDWTAADTANRDNSTAAVGAVNSCKAVAWFVDRRLTN